MAEPFRIMVVEDDDETRAMIVEYLSGEGFVLSVHVNGQEALDYLQTHAQPDLMLSDVEMPEMSGFELAARLSRMNNLPATLFLTSRSQREDQMTGFQFGAADYLVKPFRKTALLEAIRKILG